MNQLNCLATRAACLLALSSMLALAACGTDTTTSHPAADGGSAGNAATAGNGAPSTLGRKAVVADWLNQSLSIIDLDKLGAGATRKDVELARIDLSAYSPGPLELAITPDGKTALVSVSAGFFSIPGSGFLVGGGAIPNDPGTLLFIDLESRKVVSELDTGAGPMGILLTPDGTRAFVAHFSTDQISVVDVVQRKLSAQVRVGQYSEELAIDDTGSAAIFSYSSNGNIRTFDPANLSGTLSPDVALTADAAGVAFFPGTKLAYVVQAPNVLTSAIGGHNVIDVSKPKAPVVLENVRDSKAPVSYPAVAFAARKSVIVPAVRNGTLQLLEYRLANQKAELVGTTDVTKVMVFGAFHTTIDPQGRVLCAVPREHLLTVSDLASKHSFTVDWGGPKPGPTDVQVIP